MFLSIIIPIYNATKYIPKMIKMLENQTCHDFEALFVDNGSTDNPEVFFAKNFAKITSSFWEQRALYKY